MASPSPAGDEAWPPGNAEFEFASAWALEQSLEDLKRSISAGAPRAPQHSTTPAGVETAHAGTGPPPCPNCGSWMQIKHTKDKTNWFWGCPGFPSVCKRNNIRELPTALRQALQAQHATYTAAAGDMPPYVSGASSSSHSMPAGIPVPPARSHSKTSTYTEQLRKARTTASVLVDG